MGPLAEAMGQLRLPAAVALLHRREAAAQQSELPEGAQGETDHPQMAEGEGRIPATGHLHRLAWFPEGGQVGTPPATRSAAGQPQGW